jgi:hypothetical protein
MGEAMLRFWLKDWNAEVLPADAGITSWARGFLTSLRSLCLRGSWRVLRLAEMRGRRDRQFFFDKIGSARRY